MLLLFVVCCLLFVVCCLLLFCIGLLIAQGTCRTMHGRNMTTKAVRIGLIQLRVSLICQLLVGVSGMVGV